MVRTLKLSPDLIKMEKRNSLTVRVELCFQEEEPFLGLQQIPQDLLHNPGSDQG